MHSKMEVVACKMLKLNIVFAAAMSIHVTKYICVQHLYEEADASTAKWKLWRVGLEK